MGDECFVVGLVGVGIDTSATPSLHEAEADAIGIRYAYQLIDLDEIDVEPENIIELLRAARRMGFRGLNITHPCKRHVVPYVDELSPEAEATGAVNTVVFGDGGTFGHNTDVLGFRRGMETGLPDVRPDKVIVIGAGGAGAAVAYVALQLGASRVTLIDIDECRADELATRLGHTFGDERVCVGGPEQLADHLDVSTGLIHATPIGMAAHPGMAFSPDLLRRNLWVAEVVYRPLETELLRQAREIGCRTLDGGAMAVFQAVEAFSLFTGIQPDATRMLRHFDQSFRPMDVSDDDRDLPVATGL